MARKLLIADWPFGLGELATLHWLRSPYMAGDDRHWCVDAVFRGVESGKSHDISLPWGMLPYLRLGMLFENGRPKTRSTDAGQISIVRLFNDAKFGLRRVGGVVLKNLYPLDTQTNLDELCIKVENNDQIMLVPCIEIARSFFAQSRFLSYALLQPDSFSDFVRARQSDGKVTLEFSSLVPKNMIKSDFIISVAKILFDQEWSDQWRAVWSRRAAKALKIEDKNYPKLECWPPVGQNSSWKVRGVTWDNQLLVLEILGTKYRGNLPFHEIEYSHPRLKKGILGDERSVSGSKPVSEDAEDETLVENVVSSPSHLGRPIVLYTERAEHCCLTVVTPQPVREKVVVINKLTGGSDRTSSTGDMGTKAIRPVSLQDEGGCGDVDAGEFTGGDKSGDIPPNFKNLITAMECVQEAHLRLQFEYQIGLARSRIGEGDEEPIEYLLITLKYADATGYILDVDQSSGQGISTVVFELIKPDVVVDKVVRKLVEDCIAANGFLSRELLKDQAGRIRYALAKHTQTDGYEYGLRLVRKLPGIMKQLDELSISFGGW